MKAQLASAGIIVAASWGLGDAASLSLAANTTSTVHRALLLLPDGGVKDWYYNSRSEGPYTCTSNHDSSEWAMLRAYRSGGTQGVHWKYTENLNDAECLTKWNYYSNDGQTIWGSGIGRTTLQGDSKRWCALPVYRSGGVRGKQWNYCEYPEKPPCVEPC